MITSMPDRPGSNTSCPQVYCVGTCVRCFEKKVLVHNGSLLNKPVVKSFHVTAVHQSPSNLGLQVRLIEALQESLSMDLHDAHKSNKLDCILLVQIIT